MNRSKAVRRQNAQHPVNLRQRRVWYILDTAMIGKGDTEAPYAGTNGSTPVQPLHTLGTADQSALDYVYRPIDTAWAEAEKIAARQEYTPDYKQAEIKKLFGAALAEMESNYQYEVEKLDQEDKSLPKATRAPFAPSAEDAPRMLYTVEALRARAARMETINDLHTFWNEILEDGDTVTARVLLDHGVDIARRILQRTLKGKGAKNLNPMGDYRTRDLMTKTEDMLSTPEQKKARQALANVAATRFQLEITKSRALARLNGWKMNAKGELTDGARAAAGTQIRRSF
jgi:hypothetical protein